VAEIKAMYVAPSARLRGIGRRMLDRLEALAASSGAKATRLDTLASLEAAIVLYESAGYERIARYNEASDCDLWFERRLG
jgi:ribosomal protein S18 acetylase RimI-like enzyme